MRSASLRPLRHRHFAVLWSANLVSNVGTWMQTVAVGALVTARTGKASWTALVAAATFLPIGVLAPLGGALADRLDRRRFLAAANLAQAGLATVLAVLSATGRASPGLVTAVVLLSGSVLALMLPFQHALVPDLVPREDVLAASSLGSAQYNLGRVVGPALAGVVILLSSYTWVFTINAVSFFAVVWALFVIRPASRAAGREPRGLWGSIRDGARAARAEPGCRAAIFFISVAAFLAAPFIALIPAKSHDLVVDGGERATGVVTSALTAAQGLGAVAGALLLASLAERFGRRRVLVFDLVAAPAALCLYAVAPSVPVAVAALAAVGSLYIGVLSGLNTVVQLRTPAQFRGRVLALYLTALGTIYPLGSLVQGAVADVIGLSRTTVIAALLMVSVVALVGLARPQVLRALGDPPAEPAVVEEATAAEPFVTRDQVLALEAEPDG